MAVVANQALTWALVLTEGIKGESEYFENVKLGKGIRPENQESYEAREIIKNMRTKYKLDEAKE